MAARTTPPATTSADATAIAATEAPTSTTDTMATTDTVATADTTATTDTMPATAIPATAGGVQFVKREMTQPVAASVNAEAAASGDLPICKKDQQDGCINAYEKTGKGNKPLNYWPGKPASEIPGKKPQA